MSAVLSLMLCSAVSQGSSVAAGEFDFAVDIPTTINATTYQPSQTIHAFASGATYSYTLNATGPGAGLPAGVRIDALARRSSDGLWLLSVDVPTTVAAMACDPADILSFNGSTYAKLYEHASHLGLPPGSNISGLAEIGGSIYLSLGSLTRVTDALAGPTLADPRDILRVVSIGPSASYARVFQGGSAGVPPGGSLTGFELVDASTYLITVDVPFTGLSATAYQPGDLIQVRTSPTLDSLFYRDSAVFAGNPSPPNVMNDFSLPLPPGEVLDLSIDRAGGGNLIASWNSPASCSTATTISGYALYEGTIGQWYSHSRRIGCDFGSSPQAFTPGPQSTYYLVVPNNGLFEGAYGHATAGDIPASSARCRPLQRVVQCQ